MPIITCTMCNNAFDAARSDKKYCSESCRKKFKRDGAAPKKAETKSKTEKVVEKVEKNAAQLAYERLMKRLGKDKQQQNLKLEFVPSGFEAIDKMISLSSHTGEYIMVDGEYFGGFPRSAVSEIYGRKGVGKSNWLMRILSKNVSSMLYFDTEGATKEGPESIPVPNNVIVRRTNVLEEIWEEANAAILHDDFDVIVVDGIAGLTTNKELADDNDPGGFQNRAKLLSNWLRTMESAMKNSRTAVIFTNQQKESMDPFKPKQTMGGAAVGYYASLRLELLSTPSTGKIVKDGIKVGHKIRVKLDKNRFGPDGQETEIKFMFKDLAGGHESGTNKDS